MLVFLIVKGLDLSPRLTHWSCEAPVYESVAMDGGHRVRHRESLSRKEKHSENGGGLVS